MHPKWEDKEVPNERIIELSIRTKQMEANNLTDTKLKEIMIRMLSHIKKRHRNLKNENLEIKNAKSNK